MIVLWALTTAVFLGQTTSVALDFDFFKIEVQPIFLEKREGLTRCIVCHNATERVAFLEELAPGATTWNEEQARKNFEAVSKLVTPGEPLMSRLLVHPLAPEAGGDEFHTGGRQFSSQEDPHFKILTECVMGDKASGR